MTFVIDGFSGIIAGSSTFFRTFAINFNCFSRIYGGLFSNPFPDSFVCIVFLGVYLRPDRRSNRF